MKNLFILLSVAIQVSSCSNPTSKLKNELFTPEGGQRDGNSGDAVICSMPGGEKKAELLDYFEARKQGMTLYPDEMRRFDEEYSNRPIPMPNKLARDVFKRISKFDSRLNAWADVADQFCGKNASSGHEYFQSRDLRDDLNFKAFNAEDSGKVDLPENCSLRQAALQYWNSYYAERQYVFSNEFWDNCGNGGDSYFHTTERAGLLVHEIVYRSLFERGQTDSTKARRFVAQISRLDADKMTQAQYDSLAHEAGFDDLMKIYNYKNNQVEIAYSSDKVTYQQASTACSRYGVGFDLIQADGLSLLNEDSDQLLTDMGLDNFRYKDERRELLPIIKSMPLRLALEKDAKSNFKILTVWVKEGGVAKLAQLDPSNDFAHPNKKAKIITNSISAKYSYMCKRVKPLGQ